MIVDKSIARFAVFEGDSVLVALNKISANKRKIAVVVSSDGRLTGVVSDGDVRRWLLGAQQVDLDQPVSQVCNGSPVHASVAAPREAIAALFSDRIAAVPLVDANFRFVALALPQVGGFAIGERLVGEGQPAFIIAEIGNNHQGDLALARRLVDDAVAAGADCAKFQLRDLARIYGERQSADKADDLGAEYTLDLLQRYGMSADDLFRVFDHCLERGIMPLCTPWDTASADRLAAWGMKAFKVASADLTNTELVAHLCGIGRPLILSTGMSTEAEIIESIGFVARRGTPHAVLHCNSTYPTPFKDVNLTYLPRLKELTGAIVGYSGHERGYHVPVAAVALGAKVIEKHLTFDRNAEGNDHRVSLLRDEFARMVTAIREVEESIGQAGERRISQGERINRETLAKSLVARAAIQPGEVITAELVEVRSPGRGLQPNRLPALIGRKARRRIEAGDFFFASDIDPGQGTARDFCFARPWGIPVRYHDIGRLAQLSNLKLVEYHLSYRDLELDVARFFPESLSIGYVVHAPELFARDHTLDLCTPDDDYRAHSITEMRRVIEQALSLRQWHRMDGNVQIVLNAGGFSESQPLSPKERALRRDHLARSFEALRGPGYELIPQTMPPYPWHFGGQRFHNLFVSADEISAFCRRHAARVCFDVSHSRLACTRFGWSFDDFVEEVGPYTAHLHLADASGVDGEGLQIGVGDIDFVALTAQLDRVAPNASFIPEVWQGHKNDGEGFWLALGRLEAAWQDGAAVA